MLIDFTVENYRSIKEPVTLSAIAQTSRRSSGKRQGIKPDDEIAPPAPVEGRNFSLLPVLAIFGANASGKSNLVRALDDLLTFMVHGDWSRQMRIPDLSRHFTPFKLNYGGFHAPTRFSIRLEVDGRIYTYALDMDNRRILLERLQQSSSPSRKIHTLFERQWDDETGYAWKNDVEFAGAYEQIQNDIDSNEPFLSFIVTRLNTASLKSLRDWLRQRWAGIGHGLDDHEESLALRTVAKDRPEWLPKVSELIRRFDTGISSLQVARTFDASDNSIRLLAIHHTSQGNIGLPFEEESTGTQRLFPIACKILSAFEAGTILTIDELGSNIHPNITREIVRLFQDPKTNPKRAQLIFTSHDNTLMRNNLLRRDQIWFTQKRPDGSTDLYPLTDFKPRNDLALDKAYLDGRFEAVPILPETEDLLPPLETAA